MSAIVFKPSYQCSFMGKIILISNNNSYFQRIMITKITQTQQQKQQISWPNRLGKAVEYTDCISAEG